MGEVVVGGGGGRYQVVLGCGGGRYQVVGVVREPHPGKGLGAG